MTTNIALGLVVSVFGALIVFVVTMYCFVAALEEGFKVYLRKPLEEISREIVHLRRSIQDMHTDFTALNATLKKLDR